MHALETLGSVTNICSDKTGTITEGKMAVRQMFVTGTDSAYNVGGSALATEGDITVVATVAVEVSPSLRVRVRV